MYKKASVMVIVVLFIISISFLVSGQITNNLPVPTPGKKLEIINAAYNTKVLNVATDGVPVSGNNVTVWAWDDNQTQWWLNQYNGSNYRVALYGFSLCYLGLNYHQTTTKCTVYPFDDNIADDYTITFLTGNYEYIIMLTNRGKVLGTSGSSSGSQCYWYSVPDGSSPSSSQNWDIVSLN